MEREESQRSSMVDLVTFTVYIKQSDEHALNTELKFISKEGNSLWFKDTHYQELLGLAYDKATQFYKDVQSHNDQHCLTHIQRSGRMRVLCVFRKEPRFNLKGLLVKHEHSKRLADHIFDVSYVQVYGKNVIPYMKNCFTKRGLYKYYSIVPYQLQLYVDTYELNSIDGVVGEYNSFNPDNPITSASVLSFFKSQSAANRATENDSDMAAMSTELVSNEKITKCSILSKRHRKQADPRKTKDGSDSQMGIDVAFAKAAKKQKVELHLQNEKPEEIIISGSDVENDEEGTDRFEFSDDVPDTLLEEISMLEERHENSNKQQHETQNNIPKPNLDSDIYMISPEHILSEPRDCSRVRGKPIGNFYDEGFEDSKFRGHSEVRDHSEVRGHSQVNNWSVYDDDLNMESFCETETMSIDDESLIEVIPKKSSNNLESHIHFNSEDSLIVADSPQAKQEGSSSSRTLNEGTSYDSNNEDSLDTFFKEYSETNTSKMSYQNKGFKRSSSHPDNTIQLKRNKVVKETVTHLRSKSPPATTEQSISSSTDTDQWITMKTHLSLKTKKLKYPDNTIQLKRNKVVKETVTRLRSKSPPATTEQSISSSTDTDQWITRKTHLSLKKKKLKQTHLKTNVILISPKLKIPKTNEVVCKDLNVNQCCIELSDDEEIDLFDTRNIDDDAKLLALNNERLRKIKKRMEQKKMVQLPLPEEKTVESNDDTSLVKGDMEPVIESTIETDIVPVSSGDESVDDEFLCLSTERKRKLGPKMKAKMKEIFEGYSEIGELSLRTIRQWVMLRRKTLVRIFKGEIPTKRHELFKTGGPGERSALQCNVSSVMFTDDQFVCLTDYLNELFCSRNSSNFTYMYSVIIPESIIYMLMDFFNLNYCEAEFQMFNFHRVKPEKIEFDI